MSCKPPAVPSSSARAAPGSQTSSLSRNAIQSDRAAPAPVLRACDAPTLRGSTIASTDGCAAASARITAALSSDEPSSTTITRAGG
jgi:hypothetical protein